MGILAQVCEDLAEGRRADQAWRLLIGNPESGEPSVIFTECPIAVQNGRLSEIELSYKLLVTDEAAQQAASQHQQLFNLETGASRLETIRQAVACAYLACCTTQPLARNAADEVAAWAPRALGLMDEGCTVDLPLSMMETSETIIMRALDAIDHDAKEKRSFADATSRWFAGITHSPAYELTVPILLFNSQDNSGRVAELHLKRWDNSSGRLYASPHTRLQIEMHADTRDGIERAWLRTLNELGRSDVDVQWELSGANSIAGRSAEAAFQIGLKLLLTGAPYDRQCVVSAMVDEHGKLNHVGGINENGNPKLHAATSLIHGHSGVTVITSPANRLSAPEEAAWHAKGVTLKTCVHIDEALLIVSKQLALLDDLLCSQIDLICKQATKRFDRSISNLDDFNRYAIPMQVAQGIRPDAIVDENEAESEQADDVEAEGQSERRVIPWTDFMAKCISNAVVLGDPGFGKTTLLWHEVAERCHQTRERLSAGTPITDIELAFYLPASQLPEIEANGSVVDGLVAAISGYNGFDKDICGIVAEKIAAGQCFLCIDALDEVSDPRIAERFLNRLTTDHPSVRLLLSSRLTGFSGPPIEIADDNQVELMPFTRDQMQAAVNTWFDDIDLTQKVWATVSDGKLADVLRSPILLNLARGQVADCVASGKPIPTWRRRTELYDDFIKLGFQQHRTRASRLFSQMEQEEFPIFLEELALKLWLQDASQPIFDRGNLVRHVKSVIKQHDLWGLKERGRELLDDLQHCGILVPVTIHDEDPRMMFLHRTIGEYLAGKCLARRIEDNDDEVWKLINKKCWAAEWKEVLLFCAGALSNAQALLLRLKDDTPTDDNPLGDDLLRHRLLLAAQCLPELAICDEDVTQDITDQMMRTCRIGFGVLIDEAVDAMKALIAVGAKYRDAPVQMRLRIDTSAVCFSPAAYSEEFFEFLRDKLWEACESVDRRMMKTKRLPAPYARAIVAICDTIDVQQLRRSPDDPPDQYWRVVGEVFRQASRDKSKHVQLNVEFLRYLGACWFDPSVRKPTIGLIQAVEHLPEIPKDVLLESSIMVECSRVLGDAAANNLHRRALILITSVGEAACHHHDLINNLAKLRFSVSGRIVNDVINALRPTLVNPIFIEQLVASIDGSEGVRRRAGIEMFVSLLAIKCDAWNQALTDLLPLSDFKRTFMRHFKEIPSSELAHTAVDLLESRHRPVGLQAVEALATSTVKLGSKESCVERLEQLDFLTPSLLCDSRRVSFHSPETLELLADSAELGVRLLLPAFLNMAFSHRPSTKLVDWALFKITDPAVALSDKEVIADEMKNMSHSLVTYLREQVDASGCHHAIEKHPALAALVYNDPSRVVAMIKTSDAGWEKQLQAIGVLPQDSIADVEMIEFIVSHLEQRTRGKTELALCALDRVNAGVVGHAVADKIVEAMCGRHSHEFTWPVLRMVRANPLVFHDPLAAAYQVPDSPSHEDIGEMLPALGNLLVDSSLFGILISEASSSDRRVALRARRILARTLNYCDRGQREHLLSATATLLRTQHVGAILYHDEVVPDFVGWLIGKLDCNDPMHVSVAGLLLVDRERVADSAKLRRTLITTHAASVPSQFPFSMESGSDAFYSGLARAGVSFLRLFRENTKQGRGLKLEQLTS